MTIAQFSAIAALIGVGPEELLMSPDLSDRARRYARLGFAADRLTDQQIDALTLIAESMKSAAPQILSD